jgi:serine/threonine protein kinase/tetratricopeptide (TPR) repeat protein
MIAEPWDHIKDLFDSALDLPREERAGFLSQQDPIAADQVAELLASLENSGDFMLQPCCIAYGFLEDLEVDQQRFFPGDVLCGRFRIVSLIGRGGMGEVYKAWDEEFEDHVALKTLRLEISTHQLFTSRFRRELQLARKVTHPNVCRIFDSFKHSLGDGTFISVLSMELLPGQTLADYLKTKTRLSTGEALPIVRQIVAGLSAIHAAGIAHRDLKPSNLILVPAALPAKSDFMTGTGKASSTNRQSPINGSAGTAAVAGHPVQNAASADSLASLSVKSQRQQTNISQAGAAAVTARAVTDPDIESTSAKFIIKITDFGIAGRLPDGLSQAAQTEVSKLLGTPDYMAPEQLEHARANIQSDVYSLGLVLYEMVTGTRPFAEASAWKRITTDSPPPRKLTPDLPDHWNKTIACCLERNPNYRFQSAQAVLDGLEGDPSSAKIPPKPVLVRLKRAVKGKAGLISIFFLLAMSLSVAVYRYYQQRPEIPAGTTVLLTSVRNDTNDPYFLGATAALKSQLKQSAHFEIEVAEDTRVVKALKTMERGADDMIDPRVGREVALLTNSHLVVFGELKRKYPQGYTLFISLELVKSTADFPAAQWNESFDATDTTTLLQAVQSAASWIRTKAGEPAGELKGENRPPNEIATGSWSAWQLLIEANDQVERNNPKLAVQFLRSAIDEDPNFPEAHMRLADILISMRRDREGLVEWEKTQAAIQKRELSGGALADRENLRIKGQYGEDTGRYSQAREAFESLTSYYPSDYRGLFYLGSVLDKTLRKQEAINAFSRATALRPEWASPHAHLAMVYISLKDWRSAEVEIKAVDEVGAMEWATWLRAILAFVRGDANSALAETSTLIASPKNDFRSAGYLMQAHLLADFGRHIEAVAVLEQGIQFDRSIGLKPEQADKLIGLAYLHYRQKAFVESRTLALQATALNPSPRHLLEAGSLLSLMSDRAARTQLVQMRNDKELQEIPLVKFAIAKLSQEIALTDHPAACELYFMRAMQTSLTDDNKLNTSVKPA